MDFYTPIAVWIFVVYVYHVEGTNEDIYTNKFAIKFHGRIEEVERFARDHGYTLHGQIGSLENHYLLEHPHVYRRSASHSEDHHVHLRAHPQIQWFEQQKLLSRKKRDFIEMPAEVLLNNHMSDLGMEKESSRRHRRDTKRQMPDLKFNDPLYPKMWYYHGGGLNHTDMNVMGAWKRGVTGKNVVITILDDGIERTHTDLKDNYDPYASYDVNAHDSDPMPRYDYANTNRHGTRCAGEVSAKANNNFCVVGVAYDSKIGGVRMLDGDVFDAVEAASLGHNRSHIDIYSASWGPDDDGRVVDGPGVLAKSAFKDGVAQGRNGKGSIFVWASGNGGNTKDSCNCDGYTNSIYTLSISSISQHGRKPWYLEECSSTLATTYSSGTYNEKQIITDDLHNKCTELHTGTSASAPLAAGIVALILEVKPDLTWRDVQYITLMTARPLPDGVWVTNGVGRQVSLRYGYGLMDATAMVELAEKWTTVPAQHICEVKNHNRNVDIADSGYEEMLDTEACAGLNNSVNYLEHVQVMFNISSKRRGDLVIHITSPMGTKSTILPQRPNDADSVKGFRDWAFLSVHFWGENPVGRWKLQIEVKKSSRSYYGGARRTNELGYWTLILYGTEENPVNLVQPTPPTAQPTGQTEGDSSASSSSGTTSTVSISSITESASSSTQLSVTPSQPRVTPTQQSVTTTLLSVTNKTAQTCSSQCLGGCTGPGPDKCEACRNFKMEDTGLCVQACPNNFYAQGFICKKCAEECETCTMISASQVMCLTCKPGYLLVEGKGTCRTICEKGYYKGSSTVVPVTERSDITCEADSMFVFIPEVVLPHAAGRNVTWREVDCLLSYNGSHYVGSVALSECGTTVNIEENNVTFTNDIIVHIAGDTLYDYPMNDDVTFGEDYETVIPVECIYPRENHVSTSYVPVKQNVRFFEKRYGELELDMQQFDSESFDKEVQPDLDVPRQIPLDSDVFLRIGFKFYTNDLQIDSRKCIATSTPSPADVKWHSIVENGCPTNGARILSQNNSSDFRFAFKAFEFRQGSTGFVYIHCEVSVCGIADPLCETECQSRDKRSANGASNRGSHLMSMGPFMVKRDESGFSAGLQLPTIFAVTCLVVAIVAVVIAVIGWTRKPDEYRYKPLNY